MPPPNASDMERWKTAATSLDFSGARVQIRAMDLPLEYFDRFSLQLHWQNSSRKRMPAISMKMVGFGARSCFSGVAVMFKIIQ